MRKRITSPGRGRLPATLLAALFAVSGVFTVSGVHAQTDQNVTFRFYPSAVGGERAYVPGTFNGWGAPFNPGSCLKIGTLPEMAFNTVGDFLWQTIPLPIGDTVEYKFHIHFDQAGTQCDWFTDPLNPRTNPADDNKSVLTITDPMIFEPAEELSPSGKVKAFSAGVFSTRTVSSIRFIVNGVEHTDGVIFRVDSTGIFRFPVPQELRSGAQFFIEMTDADGRKDSVEIGQLQPPIDWVSRPFNTVKPIRTIRAELTRLDGTIDPSLTEATLVRNGQDVGPVPVSNGTMETTVNLDVGDNDFQLRATINALELLSEPLTVTRRLSPLERVFITAFVSGGSNNFSVALSATALAPDGVTTAWTFDNLASTTGVSGLAMAGKQATGTADGPGELYFNVTATRPDGAKDFMRIAVIIDANGNAQTMRYEENAAWVKNAVVYEIFPLTFGSLATGISSSPGNRLNEIRANLEYIAAMGFNTIWFMPIMQNQFMDPLSGGYNITDFLKVDPKLGTNDDFRALVGRAHELGIRIVLDITPNHVSPVHPWVNSLRVGGDFSPFIQTTPNNHTSGLDGRGANLNEIWQVEGGKNLYRKYDGFGDLANINWADDDLQATMLETLQFWVEEFGIDGWRFDVYWGPWRKWGPDRFGRPIRNLMKRIRPDSWLLGEIAGTGTNTEVYYADNRNGTRVVGGLDSGYDWEFFWNAVRGRYSANDWHDRALVGGFWPGPNARYFRFLENHDETRIAKMVPNKNRIKVMTGFLMTTTGIPMIYQGQEVNYGAGSSDTRRTPVSWNTPVNGEFALLHQQLAHLRTEFPAFTTQDLVRIPPNSGSFYAAVRPLTDENAVVLINFASVQQTFFVDPSDAVQMSIDGPIPYYDVFADTSGSYLGGFTVTVPAYTTVVYITSDDPGFTVPSSLPALPFGAVYTANEDEVALPERVVLDQNYPNPFNPETTIRYTLNRSGRVSLVIYDALGREIARPVDGIQTPGTHSVLFDAGRLPSGIYFYRLETGSGSKTRSMILLR